MIPSPASHIRVDRVDESSGNQMNIIYILYLRLQNDHFVRYIYMFVHEQSLPVSRTR